MFGVGTFLPHGLFGILPISLLLCIIRTYIYSCPTIMRRMFNLAPLASCPGMSLTQHIAVLLCWCAAVLACWWSVYMILRLYRFDAMSTRGVLGSYCCTGILYSEVPYITKSINLSTNAFFFSFYWSSPIYPLVYSSSTAVFTPMYVCILCSNYFLALPCARLIHSPSNLHTAYGAPVSELSWLFRRSSQKTLESPNKVLDRHV